MKNKILNIKDQISEVIEVKQDEELVLPILWFGETEKIEREVHLNGENAAVKILALLIGRHENKLEMNINVIHGAKETKSQVVVKGILGNSSRVGVEGLVRIEKGAKESDAYLSSKLLLFSKETKGMVTPGLEILENDVRAGHSAAVGRVSNEELFYLMSRGLSEKQAKQLIVQGFLMSLIDDFPQELSDRARKELEKV